MASANDVEFAARAIEEARNSRQEGGKGPPFVGAVASRDDKLLGAAHRGELALGEHAEFTLLERKLRDAKLAGATVFTTLEPCTKRGRGKSPVSNGLLKDALIGLLLERSIQIRTFAD